MQLRVALLAWIALSAIGLFSVGMLWAKSISFHLAPAGFLQVSDAGGYWFGAVEFLSPSANDGAVSSTLEFCQRRLIYPVWLAGLITAVSGNVFGALALQIVLIAAGIVVFSHRVWISFGLLHAFVCVLLLSVFALWNCLTMTMTEVAGLLFGLTGASWLLLFSTRGNTVSLFAGLSMIGIGLVARAGALLVLPALVLWAGLCAWNRGKGFWRTGASAVAACAVGFSLQSGVVALTGVQTGQSFGNFSYTVYGLVSGGEGWMQVSKDHPEIGELSDREANRKIYQLAAERFQRNPWDTVRGLRKNFRIALDVGSYGYWMLPPFLAVALKLCWWIALIPLLRNPRRPVNALIVLVTGANFLSSLLLYDTSYGVGLSRIFAATVWADALQIAVGACFVVALVKRVLRGRCATPVAHGDSSATAEDPAWPGVLLTALVCLPFITASLAAGGLIGNITPAPAGDDDAVRFVEFAPGKGAALGIYFSDASHPNWAGWQAKKANVLNSVSQWTWWREGLEKAQVRTIWHVPVQARDSLDGSSVLRLYAPESHAERQNQGSRVVFDPRDTIELFGERHAKIVSVHSLID